MEGKSIFINSKKGKYVEFAQPLIISVNVSSNIVNNKSSIIGVLYIRYSMEDVQSYRKTVDRFAAIADSLVAVFALIMAWICSVAFNRPIKEMYGSIKRITHGHTHDENKSKYPEITKITEDFSHYVDRMKAQNKTRQEFVSNVSHELKTPLTSISGYAEIMKNGLVKPEDMKRFSENIYQEAQRMITLIGDIIKLSQLDENRVELEKQAVDLYPIAQSVVSRLKERASQAKVALEIRGEGQIIEGTSQILDEMIYNLCDNGIKYNKVGGHVNVTVGSRQGCPFVSVEDNGIGIPEEDQKRVFERFYRVDKSHSRQIGGTGLGLSIVKHGAIYHNAKVEMESTPGRGTSITIVFPEGAAK